MIALYEHEAGLCPCGCGQPLEVAEDPTQVFKVHTFTCRARRAIEKVKRDQAAKQDERANPGWDDGLVYYAVPAEDDRTAPPPPAEPPPPARRGGRRRGH